MAYDEVDVRWSPAWLLMWGVFTVVLFASVFLLPFWQWMTAAVVLFLIPEGISLFRHRDSLPPLTYVVKRYIPRWLWFTVMYADFGGTFAYWMGMGKPTRWAMMYGLLGWMTDHFTVTYDE